MLYVIPNLKENLRETYCTADRIPVLINLFLLIETYNLPVRCFSKFIKKRQSLTEPEDNKKRMILRHKCVTEVPLYLLGVPGYHTCVLSPGRFLLPSPTPEVTFPGPAWEFLAVIHAEFTPTNLTPHLVVFTNKNLCLAFSAGIHIRWTPDERQNAFLGARNKTQPLHTAACTQNYPVMFHFWKHICFWK